MGAHVNHYIVLDGGFLHVLYHRRLYMPSAPLDELRKKFPEAEISFDDGTDPIRAASAAKQADVAIVFAEQFTAEAHDVLSLSLPDNQDRLIEAVSSENRNTVVVLETGGPVSMPWIDRVPAVIEAWYSGNRGGAAIANVLAGTINPSGHLPITFPASVDQLPNPQLPGSESIKMKPGSDLYDMPKETESLVITYPEGADVGYRWFARDGRKPLFPFGYGLSYTSFEVGPPKIKGTEASMVVRNTGRRAGASVAQLYLVGQGTRSVLRLVAFRRVELRPGERRTIRLRIDPRLLANWTAAGWQIPAGQYTFAAGQHAEDLQNRVRTTYADRTWRD